MVDGKPGEVLGGTRVGAGAWGVGWVDTVMNYRPIDQEKVYEERMRLVEEAEEAEARRARV